LHVSRLHPHWARAWGLDPPPQHAGILLVPNGRAPAWLVACVDGFFRATPPLPTAGRLYRWVEPPGPAPGHWREVPPSPS
jgi:hypothetical protein